jgi:hypothetical protein
LVGTPGFFQCRRDEKSFQKFGNLFAKRVPEHSEDRSRVAANRTGSGMCEDRVPLQKCLVGEPMLIDRSMSPPNIRQSWLLKGQVFRMNAGTL